MKYLLTALVAGIFSLITVAMFQMPPDANTFQGWAAIIQVIISGVTGYFLIQTFTLQAQTFEQQRKVTEMEGASHRIKLMPRLELSKKESSYDPDTDMIVTSVTFEVKENAFQKLRIEVEQYGEEIYEYILYPFLDHPQVWLPGNILDFWVHVKRSNLQAAWFAEIHFKISMTDMLGNTYHQHIRFYGEDSVSVTSIFHVAS